jgi:hypothetical protein
MAGFEIAGIGWKSRPGGVARAEMNRSDAAMTEPDDPDEGFDLVLDPKVQESIGRSLKAHYDDIVNAPVPDKFLMLLAQLEATEQRAAGVSRDESP